MSHKLQLTTPEIDALGFARGRYSWPDRLLDGLDPDTGIVTLEEHEMWEWQHDVEDDQAGGHSPFPLAAPAFAEKLRRFLDEIV